MDVLDRLLPPQSVESFFGTVGRREGNAEIMVELPPLAEQVNVFPFDASVGVSRWLTEEEILERLEQMTQRIWRTDAWLRWTALRDGHIMIEYPHLRDRPIVLDYGLEPKATASMPWTNYLDATPLDDIEAINDALMRDLGIGGGILICNSSTWYATTNCGGRSASYRVWLAEKQIELVFVDDGYRDEFTSREIPFVPPGEIIFAGRNPAESDNHAVGKTIDGLVVVTEDPAGKIHEVRQGFQTWINRGTRFICAEARRLPVFDEPLNRVRRLTVF